jgi:hypothetical protein
MSAVRSVLAVAVGLVLITAIVEPIEFALVALASDGMTTNPDAYFAVRNQPLFLAAKLVYNTVAAVAGGFVAALLARRAPIGHGIALAVVQTAAFAWALATPEIRQTTPTWMWASLIALTIAGILGGTRLQHRRLAVRRTVPGR